jgi:hypothetical protein
MTDDIVARLREDAIDHRDVAGCCDCDPKDTKNWCHALNVEEAADEIERLRAALEKIANGPRDAGLSYLDLYVELKLEARAALEGEKTDD